MSEARGKAQAALDGLVSANGLVGAGLASRDGLPVLLRFKRPVQEETFCAMAAALLGAAEAALQEVAPPKPVSALVETADLRLYVAGLDDVHLLLLAAPTSLDATKLRAAAEQARQGLTAILGG